MAEKSNLQVEAGNASSEFLRYTRNFNLYLKNFTEGSLNRAKNEKEKKYVAVLCGTVLAIGDNLETELGNHYIRSNSAIRTQMDNTTKNFGANALAEGILGLMENEKKDSDGLWDFITETVEALKKILQDIVDISIFGVSLDDLLGGLGMDFDDIMSKLDNILQVIASLFGGEMLQKKMYETEMRNVKMMYEVRKLRRLKLGQ